MAFTWLYRAVAGLVLACVVHAAQAQTPTCTPPQAPIGTPGCYPALGSAQSTDLISLWRPNIFPNSSGTVTVSQLATAIGGSLNLSTPPPIGNVTPNTGAFTTLSASSLTLSSGFSATSFTATGSGTALNVTNNASIGGLLTLGGSGTALTVTNNATVSGTLTVGTLSATTFSFPSTLTLTGSGTALALTNGNETIAGTLLVSSGASIPSGGLSFASTLDSSNYTFNNHIALWSSTYGMGITSNRLNIGVPASSTINFGVNANDMVTIGGSSTTLNNLLGAMAEFFPATQSSGDPWTEPNALQLGALTTGQGGMLYIRGQPVGFYDLGAIDSVVNVPNINYRAGINGGWENGVSAVAAYGLLDTVGRYTGMDNVSAPLIVASGGGQTVTYDATHIFFSTHLTSTQMAFLRRNMYVMTNSIGTGAAPACTHCSVPTTLYASTVSAWASDGSSITVRGWTVPGSGNTATGQVPSSTYDTSEGYTTATVFLGQTTNIFDWNSRVDLTQTGGSSGYVRSGQGWELDLTNNPNKPDYTNLITGISISFNPESKYPSADSYVMYANANAMPAGIILQLGSSYAGGNRINGSLNPAYLDAGSFALLGGLSPAPGVNSTNVIEEHAGYIDSNVFRGMMWVNRFTTGGGWPTASYNFGVQIDGARATLAGTPAGTLVFSPQGYPQGIALSGNNPSVFGVAVSSTGVPYIGPTAATINIGNNTSVTTLTGSLNFGGVTATSAQGTGPKLQFAAGSFTVGHALAFDTGGNAVDSGTAPGVGTIGPHTNGSGILTSCGAGGAASGEVVNFGPYLGVCP